MKGVWSGWLIIGVCWLVSCGRTLPPATSAVTVELPTPEPTATVTSHPPSAEPRPLPTVTPTVPCPPRRDLPFPPPPTTLAEAPALLTRYLNDGGDPAQLVPLLHEWQLLPPQVMEPVSADLTGDGTPELALALIDPAATTFPPAGTLLVYTCRAGAWDLLQTYAPGEGLGIYPVGAADFTGDGRPELAYVTETCGAHTCWRALGLWTWRDQGPVELWPADTLSLPYATFTLLPGAVLAVSPGYGSLGAGPQRTITQTWTWTGTTLTHTATEVAPATYRYHAFLDAESLFLAGEVTAALPLYERVLTDETLQPWAGAVAAAEERAGLEALAHWRLLLGYVQGGELSAAQAEYETLQTAFAAQPVARLAQQFWTAYQGGGRAAGCRAALAAPEAAAVVEFLNQFGYANPTYEVAQLCLPLLP